MDVGSGDVVLQTLQLLEWRLRRLEYVFNGGRGDVTAAEGQQSIMKRIGKIEDGFSKLIAKSPAMAEIIALRKNFGHDLEKPFILTQHQKRGIQKSLKQHLPPQNKTSQMSRQSSPWS